MEWGRSPGRQLRRHGDIGGAPSYFDPGGGTLLPALHYPDVAWTKPILDYYLDWRLDINLKSYFTICILETMLRRLIKRRWKQELLI